jgi:hypothetical protein
MTIRFRHCLFTGVCALALGACSGANEPSSQPESTNTAATTTKNDQSNVQQAGPDGSRFIQKFDKDGNGTVELTELPGRMQKWMAKADTNNDGKLTADEVRVHADAMKKEHFARMDKNSDGQLSSDEVGTERWDHLKAADADNSGTVTQAEIDQAFASGKLKFGGPDGKFGGHDGRRGGGRIQRLFKLDANNDGALTQAEVGAEKWAHISVADSNSDGRVTKDEIKAAKESGKLAPMKRERPADTEEGE